MILAVAKEGAGLSWVLYAVVGPLIVAAILSLVAVVVRLFRLVAAMHGALVTRKPSELEPHPPKGLIDETKENTEAVYNMSLRINQSNGTQKDIQRVQGVILERLDALAGAPPGVTLPQVKDAIGEHDAANSAGQAQILSAINEERGR